MSILENEREIDRIIISLLKDIHLQTSRMDKELEKMEDIRKDLNHHIARTDLLTQRIDMNEHYMNKMLENQFKQNESLLEGVKAANKQTATVIIKLILTTASIMGALAILFDGLKI